MANYSLTVKKTVPDADSEKVANDLHDLLEAVDTAKVIRLLTIVHDSGQDKYVGITIYDT